MFWQHEISDTSTHVTDDKLILLFASHSANFDGLETKHFLKQSNISQTKQWSSDICLKNATEYINLLFTNFDRNILQNVLDFHYNCYHEQLQVNH